MIADVRDDVHALGKRVADCGLSDAVLDLLESCWDDDPEERPRDARALAEALALPRSVSAPVESPPAPVRNPPLPPSGPTAG